MDNLLKFEEFIAKRIMTAWKLVEFNIIIPRLHHNFDCKRILLTTQEFRKISLMIIRHILLLVVISYQKKAMSLAV